MSCVSHYTPDWLRRCFSETRDVSSVTQGDGHRFHPEKALRPAAVLIPVVHRPEAGLSVLFTRRTAHLRNHGGQISFPGGRAEPDDGSPAVTALRETEEEIGLARSHVEVLGTLSEYVTVTAYRVTPVVGLVTGLFELSPDGSEVAEVFEVPLAHLLDPTNHQRNTVLQNSWQREYYAVPYGEYYIWGATAGMVMNFYNFLRR